MRRLGKILCALAVSLVLCRVPGTGAQQTAEYAEHQVIVKVNRAVLAESGESVESLRREMDSRVRKRFELIDAELWDISGLTVE
jgi:hypothetical protein